MIGPWFKRQTASSFWYQSKGPKSRKSYGKPLFLSIVASIGACFLWRPIQKILSSLPLFPSLDGHKDRALGRAGDSRCGDTAKVLVNEPSATEKGTLWGALVSALVTRPSLGYQEMEQLARVLRRFANCLFMASDASGSGARKRTKTRCA